jgi:hypothetical protein
MMRIYGGGKWRMKMVVAGAGDLKKVWSDKSLT